MYSVHATTTIRAPRETVFARLSDHERFVRAPRITCRLVTPGKQDRNGLGAVREVTATGSVFREEVTEWDPPNGYAYVVRALTGPVGRPTPFTHERGWLELTDDGKGGTRVDWRSRFGMPIPVVGWLIERIVGPQIRASFVELLAGAKTELESAPKG